MPQPELALHPSVVVPKALPYEIVRQEALERLSRTECACVVLLASSGYGKSTVLAQYSRNTTRPVAWLTASDGNAEAGLLMRSINQAFERPLGLKVDGAHRRSLDNFAQELITQLSRLPEGMDFIIDRAERISSVHGAFLATLVDLMPEGHRLILAGYHLNGFPLARLVAGGQALVLTQDHLRFSAAETQQYLAGRNASAAAIFEATDGWPVGVALSLQGPERTVDVEDLLQDALDQLPAKVQTLLPDLSLFEEWSESSPERLDLSAPAQWLKSVRQAGLPLTPLGRGVFRPHALLLDLLRTQLLRHPERARERYAQAALWAAQGEDLSSAMRFASGAGRTDLLEAYAAQLFPALRARLEFVLLAELSGLHPGPVQSWWQEYRAIADLETGQVESGLLVLHQQREAGELSALGFTALALQAARHGEFESQLQLALAGLALADDQTRLGLLMQQAAALISLERPDEGLAVTSQLLQAAQRRNAPLEEANILNYHQYALQMLRRWTEQDAALERASVLLTQHGHPSSAVQIDTKRIDSQLLQGRTAEAEQLLRGALTTAQRHQPVHLPALLRAQARLMMARGAWAQAVRAIQDAEALIQTQGLNVLLPFLHFDAFDLYTALGDDERAEYQYQQALSTTTLPVFQTRLAPLFTGLRALDRHQDQEARQALDAAQRSSIDRAHVLRATIALAALELRAGTLEAATVQALDAALDQIDVPFLCSADRRRLEPLLQALPAYSSTHPLLSLRMLPASTSPPELELRVSDHIDCFLGAQPLKLPLAKAGELLLWLQWHGSGTLEELLSDLWDGSRSAKHHEYFRVVVRRLRQLFRDALTLDFDPVPYRQGRYSLHPDLPLRCNVTQAVHDARAGQFSALFAVKAEALLAAVDADWTASLRASILAEQLQALGTVEGQVAQRDPALACAVLQAALQDQSDIEAFHLSFIRTLLRHQPERASAAYQAYTQMLDTQFGSAPDADTVRELRQLGLLR